MGSISLPSSFLHRPPPIYKSYLHPCYTCCFHRYFKDRHHSSPSLHFSFNSRNIECSVRASAPSDEGLVSVINFEDFMEKDWSFLEKDSAKSEEVHNQMTDQIISSGEIVETSRVLVSLSSESFVDRVVDSSPCEQLLIVHDSLFILACIKEKYDWAKCWQGELIHVPENWAPFDVVFLYFLPALPFKLGQIFDALAKNCRPGARLVISHPQGRQVLEQQRKEYPDIVVSGLPDKTTLEYAAAEHSFDMVELVDEPGFYLCVLKYKGKRELK